MKRRGDEFYVYQYWQHKDDKHVVAEQMDISVWTGSTDTKKMNHKIKYSTIQTLQSLKIQLNVESITKWFQVLRCF